MWQDGDSEDILRLDGRTPERLEAGRCHRGRAAVSASIRPRMSHVRARRSRSGGEGREGGIVADNADELKKMALSALARHGPLGVALIASYVESDRTTVEKLMESLRKAGKVEQVDGKKTKRYRIKETTQGQ